MSRAEQSGAGTLIQDLLELQAREGWLSDPDLVALAERRRVPLHRLESLTSFYTHFRRKPPAGARVEVCRDLACHLAGGDAARRELEARLGDEVEIVPVSCLGRCDRAPAAATPAGVASTRDPAAIERAVAGGVLDERRPASDWGEASVHADPSEYFSTLRRVIARGDRTALPEVLSAAGLRGMGGAAFPTGRKWALVAAEPVTPRHVICNADESEPGTFKDRELLRDLPHLALEGMALAAYALEAEQGHVFIRHEYEAERRALESARDHARACGWLGPDALGPGRPFDVDIFVSPGGYILGEETALLECMEDRRGEPRNKPPYPGVAGLFGRPTLINNVETFVHATGILTRGADWWRSLGRAQHAGHKFISVCGDVERPGVRLVPFGSTLGDLLERCGGMQAGRRLGAIAPGGASSRFLPADRLDVEIAFESLAEAGSMLGSGAVMFIADDHDYLGLGLNVTRFFRNESCGKCVPCRVGTEKAVTLVEQADGLPAALEAQLVELHETLARTSLCGLGHVALAPLLSLAEHFPDKVRTR